jgi:hypothetical protein
MGMRVDTDEASVQDPLQDHVPAIRLVSSLFKLTGAGARPVSVERLAAVVGQPVEETLALARQIFRKVTVRDGLLHLDLGTDSPSARFRLRIDDRVIGAEGCAVDMIWMALVIDGPLRVEATCAATDVPIQVDLTPQGVRRANPPGTVVSVLDPAAPELEEMGTSYDAANDDVCAHQPFFASADVAGAWLTSHPGGRLYPVGEFFEVWRRRLAPLTADISNEGD